MSRPASGPGENAPAARSTHRLFVGLVPEPAAAQAIAEWARGATAPAGVARPVAAPDLHVTLAFLPRVPTGRGDEVAAVLREVWARHGGGGITLDVVGAARFGTALVLLLAVPAGVRWPEELQAALTDGLEAAALHRRDDRPWTPHLTVARIPARGPRARLVAAAPASLPLAGAVLFESRGRPPYRRLLELDVPARD